LWFLCFVALEIDSEEERERKKSEKSSKQSKARSVRRNAPLVLEDSESEHEKSNTMPSHTDLEKPQDDSTNVVTQNAKSDFAPVASAVKPSTNIDTLWKELNRPSTARKSSVQGGSRSASKSNQDSALKRWLTSSTIAQKPVKTDDRTEEKVEKKVNEKEPEPAATSTGVGDLSVVLNQLKKTSGPSVMQATKRDWHEFKDENQLKEELESHQKDKYVVFQRIALKSVLF